MRNAVCGLALLFLSTAPALATGSAACSFSDRNLRFFAEAAFSRGNGEGIMNFGGTLEVLVKESPEDFRSVPLTMGHLTQRWLYGKELKLRLYHERTGEPHAYVELIIETKQQGRDETELQGSYILNVYQIPPGAALGRILTVRGRASCSVG